MPPVRAAHGCDPTRVARSSQPIVNRGANLSTLDGRLARTMVTGDQQKDSLAAQDCRLEAAVDGSPGLVEVHPVKVENTIRLDCSGAQPTVPASIEG